MKSGYVLLLMLAVAGCTSPLAPLPPPSALMDDASRLEEPISTVQESDEQTRLALMQPLDWTQEEERVLEKSVTTPVTIDSPLQERQASALIQLKSDINTMREEYKEALAEQKKQWEKQEKDYVDLIGTPSPERQNACMELIEQQEKANIRLQNRILRAWGSDIGEMIIEMKGSDSDAKPLIP